MASKYDNLKRTTWSAARLLFKRAWTVSVTFFRASWRNARVMALEDAQEEIQQSRNKWQTAMDSWLDALRGGKKWRAKWFS